MLRKIKWQIPGESPAARYNWCQGPVPGRGPAIEKHWCRQQSAACSYPERNYFSPCPSTVFVWDTSIASSVSKTEVLSNIF